ncbi:MarC family protein [Rarobacter incanus]|uniref:MarC family protein n=1 Tax=Rarobacter incanus TaxID=153494 RepID=UPI002482FF16|nr:MarC family protein [Rarobacter incanus]
MEALTTAFVATLAALVPITNPIGAVAAHAGLSASMPTADVHRQAWRTGMWVAGILMVFGAAGSLVLSAFGISPGALQIAGGIVVMHSGFQLMTPRDRATPAEREHARTKADISFSPMALPLIAGPGAIGVVIAISARHPGPRPASASSQPAP